MLNLIKSNERGRFSNEWLNSQHTFSFGEYYNPQQMGVSVLRVINDDHVIPGAGFPTHGHKDMEIVSYVLAGELAHKDSMGNGSVIRPGDVQRMSAGTGIRHSEYNPSEHEQTNFLQIWLLPKETGIEPSYAQRFFAPEGRQGQLKLLISPDGRDDSISANTDALMYGILLEAGQSVKHTPDKNRLSYIHVAKGNITVNGTKMEHGDGATVSDEPAITLSGQQTAEVLLFDLPATH